MDYCNNVKRRQSVSARLTTTRVMDMSEEQSQIETRDMELWGTRILQSTEYLQAKDNAP